MPVEQQTPFNEYTGNGVTTVFAFQFQVLIATDLSVFVDGTLKANGTDYTITGVGNQTGGQVTFSAAPAVGADVLIARQMVLARDTDYQTNGDLREAVLDRDFDRIWLVLQSLSSSLSTSIQLPFPEQAGILPGSQARRDRLLMFSPTTGIPELTPFTATQVASAIAAAYGTGSTLDGLTFLQEGEGAIPRTAQEKARELISIADFGAIPGADATVAAIKAAAVGEFMVPPGSYIATPTAANLNAFLAALNKLKLCLGDFVVTMPDGVADVSTTLTVESDLSGLSFTMNTPTAITISSVIGVTPGTFPVLHWDGVNKNLPYYLVQYGVADTSQIVVGTYLRLAAGDTSHRGCWEITAKTASSITVMMMRATAPTSTTFTASATVLRSAVRFYSASAVTGISGIIAEGGKLGIVECVLVGTGRPVDDGGYRKPTGWDVFGGFGGVTGVIARRGGSLTLGANSLVTGFSGTNITTSLSGALLANPGAMSCCAGRNGFSSAASGGTQASGVFSVGNLIDGFISQDGSSGFYTSSHSEGNYRHGVIGSGGSTINATSMRLSGNGKNGADTLGACQLLLNSATITGNTEIGINNAGCQVRAIGATITGNAMGACTTLLNGSSNLGSSTISSNGATDLTVINGLIDVSGVAAGYTTNIPVNHISATPGYIRSATTAFLAFSGSNSTSAMRINDLNHLLIATATEMAGKSGARLHVNGQTVFGGTLYPSVDNAYDYGEAALRGRVAFFGTGTINTCDGREKTPPLPIDDAVLDAWGNVQFITFRWLDSLQAKGDEARWHFGVIAQQVRDVFAAHGLDGTRYGLLCYDEWEDRFEPVIATRTVQRLVDQGDGILVPVDIEEEYDTGEIRLVLAAGNRWGIRPDQCAFIEMAWQRRENQRILTRLLRLEEIAGVAQ